MKNIVDFLSGNIPGGIGLFALILFAILFILYFIYKTSEIFTVRHFRKWLFASWALVTLIYVLLWIKNPPQSITDRYSVIFISRDDSETQWVSQYLNLYFSEIIEPYENKYDYFFPYYWFYESEFNLNSLGKDSLLKILKQIPVEKVVLGEVIRENQGFRISVQYIKGGQFASQDTFQIGLITTSPDLRKLMPLKEWISRFIKIRETTRVAPPLDKEFIQAIELYYLKRYDLAARQFNNLLERYPQNEEVLKWLAFSEIKQAIKFRSREERKNPYAVQEKLPFYRKSTRARNRLFAIMKTSPDFYAAEDNFLNMIAESYLVEEKFGDAELFLKNAYMNNPFNIYVLENFIYLYPTRYTDLGFSGEIELLERIMILCPINLRILLKYTDAVVSIVPIDVSQVRRSEKIIRYYLKLNPNSVPAWSSLGKFYLQNLQIAFARKAFLTADSLDSNNPIIKYNLGVVAFRNGNLKEAERYFRQAVQLDDYLDAHLYLGYIYQNEGKYEQALKEYRYRVAHKKSEDDFYAFQAMKGIREVLRLMNQQE